jgi:hypothetical protein
MNSRRRIMLVNNILQNAQVIVCAILRNLGEILLLEYSLQYVVHKEITLEAYTPILKSFQLSEQ